MSSAVLNVSSSTSWPNQSGTPIHGMAASGSRYIVMQSQNLAWHQGTIIYESSAPKRTRTQLHTDPWAGQDLDEWWTALLGIAALGLAAFLQLSATPVQPETLAWWERPGIGPAGRDLIAEQEGQSQATAKTSSALAAAEDLRTWLNITYDDLATVTGIGKTTFYHWKRTGAEPRPATTYRLRGVHALIRALIAKLGMAGMTAWLRTGTPSPLELLLNGKLAGVERLAHDVLFYTPAPDAHSFSGFAPYDPETDFEVRSPSVPGKELQPPKPRRIRVTRP
jgi:hypothetical protein